MSDPRPGDDSGDTKRQSSRYTAESRNPMARSRADGPGGSGASPDPAPDSEAPTQAGPAARVRNRFSGPLLGWIIALIGALGLLLLLVMLWATGGLGGPRGQTAASPDRSPILSTTPTIEGAQAALGGAPAAETSPPTVEVPAVGAPPGPPPAIGAGFRDYYDTHGGLDILGQPISEAIAVNGREIQWFERARLERWPEHDGTPYAIQLGRLGVEYTAGRQFAPQQFFVSRPDLRFFAETGHAVGGAFLSFWEQGGALDVFGLPISEEFDEVLPDGRTYRVQYFERARLELHPEAAGTPYAVQVGLLGTALYRNDSRPDTIQPAPSQVPLP